MSLRAIERAVTNASYGAAIPQNPCPSLRRRVCVPRHFFWTFEQGWA